MNAERDERPEFRDYCEQIGIMDSVFHARRTDSAGVAWVYFAESYFALKARAEVFGEAVESCGPLAVTGSVERLEGVMRWAEAEFEAFPSSVRWSDNPRALLAGAAWIRYRCGACRRRDAKRRPKCEGCGGRGYVWAPPPYGATERALYVQAQGAKSWRFDASLVWFALVRCFAPDVALSVSARMLTRAAGGVAPVHALLISGADGSRAIVAGRRS